MTELTALLEEVHHCQICAPSLPLGARPILQCSQRARILIAGQAPGSKVHASGVPFDDASGDRLRSWMGVDRATFYEADSIAILPMGFWYPGSGKSGDLAPRPECAATWRKPLLNQLPQVELTLVLGRYAQAYHFNNNAGSLTERVSNWREYWHHDAATMLPLPHPSPRNNRWFKRNPWFEEELLPDLKLRVDELLRKTHE